MLTNEEKRGNKNMLTYKIGLARTYLITIQAEDSESAKRLSETFLNDIDLSTRADRQEYKFTIDKIELVENDVFERDDVKE